MSEQVLPLGGSEDLPLKLMLIDSDSIYRTGLRVVLEKYAQLQVVAEVENSADALQILSELSNSTTNSQQLAVDLVLLDLHLNSPSGIKLCQRLKSQYPNLPVLLLSCFFEPTQLAAAQQAGVDGYCPKGIAVAELVAAIASVAAGRSMWEDETKFKIQNAEGAAAFLPEFDSGRVGSSKFKIQNPKSKIPLSLARLSNRLRLSGLQQIDTVLAEVTAQLQTPGLTLLEQAMLAGKRRELLASRWLVNHLLATPEQRTEQGKWRGRKVAESDKETRRQGDKEKLTPRHLPVRAHSSAPLPTRPSSLTDRPSSVFVSVREKLQFNLENLTRVPLEIDILREEKKRELLNIILQKVEDTLTELRFSQVQSSQLIEMRSAIARDLWQAATTDFFGRYSTLQVGNLQIEIVNTLLRDVEIVQTAILDKIPLVENLFSYLLFKNSQPINNISYNTDNPDPEERAEIILQNLLIQVANGVVQPLLNYFADLEIIKQTYYDQRLISTREIERFRNNLSWKYRLENNFIEPKKIFESRYEMFLFVSRGIAKISIYAPRKQELAKLSGIPLVVTLVLEFRDAIAPRLRAVVEFFGNGFVYILTQVVGRAIGLIGRGILQGLGGSLQDSKNKRF